MTTQDIVAHLRFQLTCHGRLAAVGLALIATAIGFQLFSVERVRAHVAELRAEQAALRLAQRPQRLDQQEAENGRLTAFFTGLPTAAGALEAIEIIHRAAAANGVKLAHGEYRLVREGSAQGLHYQITLPARSSYPQLRAWLAEVMNAVPAAALNEISLRRDDVGGESIEARVRLTLFLRAG